MHLVWVAPQLWWDVFFPQNDESLLKPFFVYSCGLFWPPSLWVKTKSGSPSCHRAGYLFHFERRLWCLHAFNFRPIIMAGCTLFINRFSESRSILNSRALTNLNSSTSDFIGSFSFVDELYNATFVKDLGTPNHFFKNLLIKLFFFSILESDTSYICMGYTNLRIKPK